MRFYRLCVNRVSKVETALEPEWEARFEPHSYGFRPGRSAHDAIAAIVVTIERQPMFVFDADIEEAFDSVNQVTVLNKLQTYPALRMTRGDSSG